MPEGGENNDVELAKRAQAVEDYFEQNSGFLNHYARGAGFNIKVAREAGGQEIKTAAIDLEKRDAYFNPDFMAQREAPPEDAVFTPLHEIEHLNEYEELLRSPGGERVWRRHREAIKSSRAYGVLDNCYDDVKMNRNVVRNAPVLDGVPGRIYRERLFAESDLRKLPKHLQFAYSLVRNPMTGDRAVVAPEVEEAIKSLENFKLASGRELNLLEAFSRTDTKMKDRIAFQDKFLRPIMDKLLEEDMKDKQKGEQVEKDEKGEEAEQGKGEPDPNDEFGKYYDEYDKFHGTPEELGEEEVDKIAEKIIEKAREENMNPADRAFAAYAKKEGVSEHDLRQYREFKKNEVDSIVDPETGHKAVDDIREELKRIVHDRIKAVREPKRPVVDGERLALPAEAYVAVKAGKLKPAVWETVEMRPQEAKKVDAFDMHIVGDVSSSMKTPIEKLLCQRRAIAMVLEAMEELYEELSRMEPDVEHPLSIRTECVIFGSEVIFVKKLGVGLSEQERVKMYKELGEAPGSTKDFLAHEEILGKIDQVTEEELRNGKRKKLVIVTTDGESDSPPRLKRAIADLRAKGVIVVGIGVTKAGKVVITNYAPDGYPADTPADLPLIFKRVLNKELRDL